MRKKIMHNTLLVITILLIPIIILLSSKFKNSLDLPNYYNQLFEEAVVTEIIDEEVSADPVVEGMLNGRQELKVKLLTGTYKDKTFETVNIINQSHNVLAKENLHIIVGVREAEDGPKVWVYNHKREHFLYILGLIFFILLITFGGKQGLNSIVALLFTATVFIFIMIPLYFKGFDPVMLSIISVIITSIVSFLLIGGFEYKILIAILGTLSGIIVAGIISYIFGRLTNLSGINLDKGEQLVYIAIDYDIHIKGLMFSSILIASMGAVMDVAMSISSSMYELYTMNKEIEFKDLFAAGMNIGKDIMGTMTNTLILAFMGGSLSLMLLLWGYNMSFRQLINMPFISLEIIQGLAGSIGIVLTVPFTALMACIFYKRKSASEI